MQIVEIVAAVASPKHVNVCLVSICRVHITGARSLPTHGKCHPFEALEVEDMKIVSSQGSLSQPPADYVEFVSH